jgi:hypothetical protein
VSRRCSSQPHFWLIRKHREYGPVRRRYPEFVLHWDLEDLVKAMGNRPVLWTDRTNWMRRVAPLGSAYRYRYVLGDATDLSDAQDNAYLDELLQ